MYTVQLKPSAAKEFSALPKRDAAKVAAKIDALALVACPIGSKKIKGHENIWRVRFGDYRVLYAAPNDDGIVTILRISKREDAYKLL